MGKLICCFGCGRDTRAESGYCTQCIGHAPGHLESKDRPRLSVSLPDENNNDEIESYKPD